MTWNIVLDQRVTSKVNGKIARWATKPCGSVDECRLYTQRAGVVINRSRVRISAAECLVQPWASCLHTHVPLYIFVPANGRWCSAAGEVIAGMAGSSGSLPPGLWLRSPAGWLPRTGISWGTLRSFGVWRIFRILEYGTTFTSNQSHETSAGSTKTKYIVIHAEHVVHSAWILFWLWMFVCMFVCMLGL